MNFLSWNRNAAYNCLNKRKQDEVNRIGTSLKFQLKFSCLHKENHRVAFDLISNI